MGRDISNGKNPFPGPRPFEADESKFFFGREHEKLDLTAKILANRVVFLYAKSGSGKTSLLNAGVLPTLEKEEDFDVLPIVRIGDPLPTEIDPAAVQNIFVLNALRSWSNSPDVKSLLSQTLTDFLFDDFIRKSKNLAEDESRPAPRVLVFDQFEQIFTNYQERWKDRREFFVQLAAALAPDPDEWTKRLVAAGLPPDDIGPDHSLRVVFALREEYLADLHSYADLLPAKPNVRVRIERLRSPVACEAMENPAQLTGKPFEKGVADDLVTKLLKIPVKIAGGGVDQVQGEFVEPVQLQIVCKKLFQILPANKRTIDFGDLLKLGDVNEPLGEYYNAAIARAVELTHSQESVLRDWFEHSLITSAGTRGTTFMDPDSPNPSGVPPTAVKLFEDLYLVRRENRPAGVWYELTHDRFIEPILQSNKRWRDQYADEKRQRLEAKATKWSKNEDGPLNEEELKAAENWLTTPEAAALGYSKTLLAYIKTSRAEVDSKRLEYKTRTARRLRQLAAAMAVLFVIAIGAAGYAQYQRNEVAAINQRLEVAHRDLLTKNEAAVKGKADADVARAEALAAKDEAIAEKEKAEDARQEAQDANILLQQANERAEQNADKARKSADEAQRARYEAETSRANLAVVNSELAAANSELNKRAGELKTALDSAKDATKSAERFSRISQAREQAAASRSEEQDPFQRVNRSVEAIKTTINDDLTVKEAIDSLHAVLPGALLEMPPLADRSRVVSASFTGKGSDLITVSADKSLKRWNMSSEKSEKLAFHLGGQIGSAALSPDGKFLAVSTSEESTDPYGNAGKSRTEDGLLRNIKLINLGTGQESIILGHRRGVLRLGLDSSGEYLATSNTFGNYAIVKVNIPGKSKRLWDKPDTIEKLRVRIFHEPFRLANTFAFSHPETDGNDERLLLATGFQNGEVAVRDAKSGDLYARLPSAQGHTDTILAMAFHPREKYLVTSGRDDAVLIWNLSPKSLQTGKKIALVAKDLSAEKAYGIIKKYHDNPVTSIAFAPEGRLMATGSEDRTVWIWEVDPSSDIYKPLVRLPDHTAPVMSVTFSADGKRLATIATDNKARIWDMSSLDEYLTLKREVERIYNESKNHTGYITGAGQLGITQLVQKLEDFLKRHSQNRQQ